MTSSKQIPRATLAYAALCLGLLPAAILAQEPSGAPERRVMVWRTEGGHDIDLEAVSGRRGFLGVGLLDLTPELRDHFGVPEDRGIMISAVLSDSPAERAGLLPADILTAADGVPLPASIDLSMRVGRAAEGTELELERWREGRREVVKVPIEVRHQSQLDLSPVIFRRIEVKPGHRIQIETTGPDQRWLEDVVETVGDSFSEATFIQQLEALRRERGGLLDKLRQMELRLEELENELRRLDSDDR